MEKEKTNKVRKSDIARRIAKKYKGITYQATADFIDLICDEIIQIVFEEKKEVVLPRVASIKLNEQQRHGYDFKKGEYVLGGTQYRLSFKPQYYIKDKLAKLNKELSDKEV